MLSPKGNPTGISMALENPSSNGGRNTAVAPRLINVRYFISVDRKLAIATNPNIDCSICFY